jgi:hypothetical protein
MSELVEDVDVLIVCCQGTYEDGVFYSEFPEQAVFSNHLISIPHIFRHFGYHALVLSGGYTKPQTPSLSEAHSVHKVWEDAGVEAPTELLFEDSIALDSAENLFIGLLEFVRQWKKRFPGHSPRVRRVGIYSAWLFKRLRFVECARALGLEGRFYFHGASETSESVAGDVPAHAEGRLVAQSKEVRDPLLLRWETATKRLLRGGFHIDYPRRTALLRHEFSLFFDILRSLADAIDFQDVAIEDLQRDLAREFTRIVRSLP